MAGIPGHPAEVRALCVYDDGSGSALYASGTFATAGGVAAYSVARWNGTVWAPLGTGVGIGDGSVYAMTVHDDGGGPALYIGGLFGNLSTAPQHMISKWNGSTWSSLGSGMDWIVWSLASYDDGSGPVLFAGGDFTTAGGVACPWLARWNGSSWSSVGGGMNQHVGSLRVWDDGSGAALYAGGTFTSAGGLAVGCIAKWDGSTWSGLGAGFNQNVGALCAFDDGSCYGPALYAGGDFLRAIDSGDSFLARWQCTQAMQSSACTATFCIGNGVQTHCPCKNDVAGLAGCINSTGHGAGLGAFGTASILSDSLVLHAAGEPSGTMSILFQGSVQLSPNPFGDGQRCVGGALKRLYTKTAIATVAIAPAPGDLSVTARSATLSDPLYPGSVRYMQAYYRDPVQAFCSAPQGNAFNASSGLIVTWGP